MANRIRRRALVLGGLVAASRPLPAGADAAALERSAAPAAGDFLVRLDADGSAHLVTPGELRLDAPPLDVWPMQPSPRIVRNGTRFNQILLLRLAPDPAGGLAAFSAICTHASCFVAEWNAGSGQLICPCHASVYAARQHGAVVSGPAPRPLPSLPLRVSGGVLRVAAGFSGRVGGDSARTM